MIPADDFLQTCYITLMLSGHVSTIILMQGSDSKYREICFNRALTTENSDPKNVTNPCLSRVASKVVYPVYHSSRYKCCCYIAGVFPVTARPFIG